MRGAVESTGEDLRSAGLARFAEMLEGLEVTNYPNVGVPQPANLQTPPADLWADALLSITDPTRGASGPVLLEVRRTVTPALIAGHLRERVELIRRLAGDAAVLVISEWISPRARQLLDDLGYGFLDLTGNVHFRLNRPVIRIQTQGARTDPRASADIGSRQLKGLRAGRLVRALADVAPPYTASALADATQLSPPYVSRLLSSMYDQGLIGRRGRQIIEVHWQELLRARAEVYSLFKASRVMNFVSAGGPVRVLGNLSEYSRSPDTGLGQLAVTGHFAAARIAPAAAGGQLMIYMQPPDTADDWQTRIIALRQQLQLLPQDKGGDVVVLSADDPALLTSLRLVEGVPEVALSQLVLDCLAGPGRMPAEGEEILAHMERDIGAWRQADLRDWRLGQA